eukprot:TRINITY_DN1473_c0_g1_i18.p1 TRINITY_DN1473_c0_g1~~TRINITY_DN1473_c0_g1_i18.p1  ORF type:complete len:812 (+),score=196.67 TRINITY_DN1473_c0_g1_i18:740-3175(+)
MLLIKGGKPHIRPASTAIISPNSYCQWKDKTPFEIATTEEVRELLRRSRRQELVMSQANEILSSPISVGTPKVENVMRIKLNRLAVSEELQKQTYLQSFRSRHKKKMEGGYTQLKDRSHETYASLYDPKQSFHEQKYRELERYGYNFEEGTHGDREYEYLIPNSSRGQTQFPFSLLSENEVVKMGLSNVFDLKKQEKGSKKKNSLIMKPRRVLEASPGQKYGGPSNQQDFQTSGAKVSNVMEDIKDGKNITRGRGDEPFEKMTKDDVRIDENDMSEDTEESLDSDETNVTTRVKDEESENDEDECEKENSDDDGNEDEEEASEEDSEERSEQDSEERSGVSTKSNQVRIKMSNYDQLTDSDQDELSPGRGSVGAVGGIVEGHLSRSQKRTEGRRDNKYHQLKHGSTRCRSLPSVFPREPRYNYRHGSHLSRRNYRRPDLFPRFDPLNTHQEPDDLTTINGIINWNERFQSCIQRLRELHINVTDQERTRLYAELVHLERDFLYCSETYGKIIISEYYLPNSEKTIKPVKKLGYAGGDKYIVHNILFKLAIDSQSLFGSSDWAAAKVGGHELKGLTSYWNCNLDLSLPLMALVDYRGFRIIAMSILPITHKTIVSGSCDAGATVHASCDEMNQLLKKAAKILNLQEHVCGVSKNNTKLLNTATDLEGHIGLDGRLYIIDFSRSFPPEAPNSKFERSYLYRLLRPEFVKQYKEKLCPDAFSNFIIDDPNAELYNEKIYEATLSLVKTVIPQFSKHLDLKVTEALNNNQLKKFSITTEEAVVSTQSTFFFFFFFFFFFEIKNIAQTHFSNFFFQ